eukprot:2764871-Rhodomonas_salina.4
MTCPQALVEHPAISQDEGEEFDCAVGERLAELGLEGHVSHLVMLAVPGQIERVIPEVWCG